MLNPKARERTGTGGGGTILITGSSTPLAQEIISLLLSKHPHSTLLLTSRNPSRIPIPELQPELQPKSQCSTKPQSQPTCRIITKPLDLSCLTSVHDFATTLATDIQLGLVPPLEGIICAAYADPDHSASRNRKRNRNRLSRVKNRDGNTNRNKARSQAAVTEDGYERVFQVNFLAHAALVLRLLGHFRREGGRVVLFGEEDGFVPGGDGEVTAELGDSFGNPDDLDDLVEGHYREPGLRSDCTGEDSEYEYEWEWEWELKPDMRKRKKTKRKRTKGKRDLHTQQYTISRRATVMWTHALNRHLEEDLALGGITAAAVNINPGIGSRIRRRSRSEVLTHLISRMSRLFSFSASLKGLTSCLARPFLNLTRQNRNKIKQTATDITNLVTNIISPFEGGYLDLQDRQTLGIRATDVTCSSWNSFDHDEEERRQEVLWGRTLVWAGVEDGNTALKVQFG